MVDRAIAKSSPRRSKCETEENLPSLLMPKKVGTAKVVRLA